MEKRSLDIFIFIVVGSCIAMRCNREHRDSASALVARHMENFIPWRLLQLASGIFSLVKPSEANFHKFHCSKHSPIYASKIPNFSFYL